MKSYFEQDAAIARQQNLMGGISKFLRYGLLAAAAAGIVHYGPEWWAKNIPHENLKMQQMKELKHDVTLRNDSTGLHNKAVVKLELK